MLKRYSAESKPSTLYARSIPQTAAKLETENIILRWNVCMGWTKPEWYSQICPNHRKKLETCAIFILSLNYPVAHARRLPPRCVHVAVWLLKPQYCASFVASLSTHGMLHQLDELIDHATVPPHTWSQTTAMVQLTTGNPTTIDDVKDLRQVACQISLSAFKVFSKPTTRPETKTSNKRRDFFISYSKPRYDLQLCGSTMKNSTCAVFLLGQDHRRHAAFITVFVNIVHRLTSSWFKASRMCHT